MARPCLVPSHCNSARIHDRISAERDVGIRRFTCFTMLLQRSHEQRVCQLMLTTMSIPSTNTLSFLILFHYGSPIAPLLDIEFCSTPCPCDGIVNFLPSLTLFRSSPSRSHSTDCSRSGKHIPNSQFGVTVRECRSEYGTQQNCLFRGRNRKAKCNGVTFPPPWNLAPGSADHRNDITYFYICCYVCNDARPCQSPTHLYKF
ncbi:hypothetical protein BDR06DRAFT_106548 [Suillus hirtellus]|nr:hypothetical protein BDR06DRAFT_106548 [Suillus hirtellus]